VMSGSPHCGGSRYQGSDREAIAPRHCQSHWSGKGNSEQGIFVPVQ
jgi:hypothetical protein